MKPCTAPEAISCYPFRTNTGWQQWHSYTISGITVGNSGRLIIGFEGDMNKGDWGKLDDVVVSMQ